MNQILSLVSHILVIKILLWIRQSNKCLSNKNIQRLLVPTRCFSWFASNFRGKDFAETGNWCHFSFLWHFYSTRHVLGKWEFCIFIWFPDAEIFFLRSQSNKIPFIFLPIDDFQLTKKTADQNYCWITVYHQSVNFWFCYNFFQEKPRVLRSSSFKISWWINLNNKVFTVYVTWYQIG